MLLLFAGAVALQAREVHVINRDWKFFSVNESSSDQATSVNIPHTWNRDAFAGSGSYFRGANNYVKNIDVPVTWHGRRVFVRFGGANSVTNLFVNGKHAGEHRGGGTAFAFEITQYVETGAVNALWVIVNNAPRLDVLPTAGDMNVYGGILRDVELIVTDLVSVSPLEKGSSGVCVKTATVSQASAKGEVEVRVLGAATSAATQVQYTIYDSKKRAVASESARVKFGTSSSTTVNIPFAVENPELWQGVENPHLYSVEVKVVQGAQVMDSVVVSTGFRTFVHDKIHGFILNNNPLKIRGVNVHQDRAQWGSAITKEQVEEDFEMIKEMGVNAVRVVGAPHHPHFYELCDRAGIIVWSDIPLIGSQYLTQRDFLSNSAFMDNGTEQLQEIIAQQYNHPSVVVWGIFSNITERGDSPIPYIRTLNNIAKKADPLRLTGAVSNGDGEMNFVTDLVLWDHEYGWREGVPADITAWITDLKSDPVWQNIASGITYKCSGSVFDQADSLYRPPYNGIWHPERWQTHLHQEYLRLTTEQPMLWGIFVGNMFDYGAASRNWGDGGGVNNCGLVSFDRKYHKDSFYLYKANWNKTDKFVYISQRREIERRSEKQTFTIFSNCEQVELLVNGQSHGVKQGVGGSFVWSDVALTSGSNVVQALSGDYTDHIVVGFVHSATR